MNSCEATVLAIDIGSTRTHMGVVDIKKLICLSKGEFNNTEFNNLFVDTVKKITFNHQISKTNISSCVKELGIQAKQLCACFGLGKIEIIKAHDALAVEFKYENPEKLGADRICNALACALLFKNQNCVIIDCGTAVTIDYLRKGKIFEGGVIFAGTATHAASLHKQTDSLPLVNFDNSGAPALPANSTTTCITAGILYATAGAIDRCIEEYRNIHGKGLALIATGGGWEIIKPLLKHKRQITDATELTLVGAGVY
ncbi:MAG: type III pantothenate kinase [Chitinispirillales bacterium]|jgi:type III pantothenate kinase|nr:type III pantothenate kinase [Chitinispirillales bacterium]